MKKPTILERTALVVIVAMLVTNPLTGQYVMNAVDWGFAQLFIYGSYVSLIGTVFLMGLGIYYYIKSSKIKIPKKNANTEKQKYLTV